MKVVEEYENARVEFEEMTPEKRSQESRRNGRALKFEALEHGGKYPDKMTQALRVIDLDDRTCTYEPAEELAPEKRPQDLPRRGGAEVRSSLIWRRVRRQYAYVDPRDR